MDGWGRIATIGLPILVAVAAVVGLVVLARRPPDWDRHAPRTETDLWGRWEDGKWIGPPEQSGNIKRFLIFYIPFYVVFQIVLQLIPKPAIWWVLSFLGIVVVAWIAVLVIRARRKRSATEAGQSPRA
jgi:hypothetical protein